MAFYCDRSVLPIPVTDYVADQHVLFGWQWDLWVVEDVLEAIAAANRDESDPERRSARVAPVKRVVSLEITGIPGADPEAAPPAAAPNAGNELTPSYDVSLTGRVTNPLYDVRRVRLTVVAETRRLPRLFDALAERNLITILDVDLKPADPWAAVADGYYYGNEPVSEVVLELETVWLREWTREHMPVVTRGTLGVWAPSPDAGTGDA